MTFFFHFAPLRPGPSALFHKDARLPRPAARRSFVVRPRDTRRRNLGRRWTCCPPASDSCSLQKGIWSHINLCLGGRHVGRAWDRGHGELACSVLRRCSAWRPHTGRCPPFLSVQPDSMRFVSYVSDCSWSAPLKEHCYFLRLIATALPCIPVRINAISPTKKHARN